MKTPGKPGRGKTGQARYHTETRGRRGNARQAWENQAMEGIETTVRRGNIRQWKAWKHQAIEVVETPGRYGNTGSPGPRVELHIVDDPLTPVLLPPRLHSQQPSLLIHQASLGRSSLLSCYLSSHLSNYIANNPLPPALPPLRLHSEQPSPTCPPHFFSHTSNNPSPTNYSNYIVNNPLPYLSSLLSALHSQQPSPTCPPICLLTHNPVLSPTTLSSHPSRLH